MKNRKTVVVAFLLIATLLLGVGYAALNDTLTVAGQANVTTGKAEDALNEDVYFYSATATSTTGTSGSANTASILQDNDRASFTVHSLALGGETATFTFVIYNESNHEVTLSTPTVTIRDLIADGVDVETDNDNVFTVETAYSSTTLPAATDASTPGQATLTVTVTLYEAGMNPENAITGYFDIAFNATAQ
ncbi:MAG: hypothetical protein IJW49_11455 [Clostridia bacterium]|nr:hypothetical protein [Clostridia bacterium]